MSNLIRATVFANINSVILTAHGPQHVSEFSLPIRHEHFICLEPLLIGVCHSDIKEIKGLRAAQSQFGHELVAKVINSSGDLKFMPGNLVALNPNIELNRNSGFSSLIVADGSKEDLEDAFFLLPSTVSAQRLIFAEPLACATHCIKQTLKHLEVNDFQGKKVLVYGAGIAGALLALTAKKFKANVLLANSNDDRLEFLRAANMFDACELNFNDNHYDEYDIAIIATAFVTNDIINQVSKFIVPDSLMVIYGGTKHGDNIFDVDFNLLRISETNSTLSLDGKLITLLGSYGTDKISFQTAINWLAAADSDLLLEKLIVSTVVINELAEKLKQMTHERTLGKVVVKL